MEYVVPPNSKVRSVRLPAECAREYPERTFKNRAAVRVAESSSSSIGSPSVSLGALFGSVLPVPESDHSPVPSSLVARTCTSYSVLVLSPEMVAVVALMSVSVISVQLSWSFRLQRMS